MKKGMVSSGKTEGMTCINLWNPDDRSHDHENDYVEYIMPKITSKKRKGVASDSGSKAKRAK